MRPARTSEGQRIPQDSAHGQRTSRDQRTSQRSLDLQRCFWGLRWPSLALSAVLGRCAGPERGALGLGVALGKCAGLEGLALSLEEVALIFSASLQGPALLLQGSTPLSKAQLYFFKVQRCFSMSTTLLF